MPLLLDGGIAGGHHQVSKQIGPGLVRARRVIVGRDNHFHELVEKAAFLLTEEQQRVLSRCGAAWGACIWCIAAPGNAFSFCDNAVRATILSNALLSIFSSVTAC